MPPNSSQSVSRVHQRRRRFPLTSLKILSSNDDELQTDSTADVATSTSYLADDSLTSVVVTDDHAFPSVVARHDASLHAHLDNAAAVDALATLSVAIHRAGPTLPSPPTDLVLRSTDLHLSLVNAGVAQAQFNGHHTDGHQASLEDAPTLHLFSTQTESRTVNADERCPKSTANDKVNPSTDQACSSLTRETKYVVHLDSNLSHVHAIYELLWTDQMRNIQHLILIVSLSVVVVAVWLVGRYCSDILFDNTPPPEHPVWEWASQHRAIA